LQGNAVLPDPIVRKHPLPHSRGSTPNALKKVICFQRSAAPVTQKRFILCV